MFNKIIQIILKIIFSSEMFMKNIQKDWNPKKNEYIKSRSLYELLGKKIGNKNITDSKYMLCNKEDIETFLSNTDINFRKYVPEKYDCDNYAFSLMGRASFMLSGYAIGIVFVKTKKSCHALNFFIDEKKNLWYIEPQTDQVFSFNEKTEYEPYFILM